MALSTDETLDLSRGSTAQWISYLQMLSVERTEAFLSELRIPIYQGAYSEVMRFTRACLEVFMFPSISRRASNSVGRGQA